MIEASVAMALFGIGYFVNKKKPSVIPVAAAKTLPKAERPTANAVNTMQNIYSNNMYNTARATEFDAVKKAKVQEVRSELSGVVLDTTNFHGNMVPFLRGSVTQNVDPGANRGIVENYGTSRDILRKKEISGMFVPEKNTVSFDPTALDNMKARYVNSRMQNNVLPFDQVKVGPGVGQGFSAEPTGGFQQLDLQEYTMPKNVDQLRPANKPKLTYDGRVLDGLKAGLRGNVGKVEQNRVPRTFEMGPERYMKTTGAVVKPGIIPIPEAKYTSRQTTSQSYKGTAYQPKGSEQRPAVAQSSRSVLEAFNQGIASLTLKGTGNKDDYGKASVQVYSNERDVTTTRTHQSNLTTVVKAIIAPIQDMLKSGRKEFLIDAPRPDGIINVQIPSKQTVRDPNDVARTTIKQSNIHDGQLLNVRNPGANKITVYNPNDVARTTMKQTLIHDGELLNVKRQGPVKATVYDTNDVARTTLKQDLIHDSDLLNIKMQAPSKIKVHDTNDVARTTLKEELIHDADMTQNIRPLQTRGTVYLNDEARTTTRQTTENAETVLNMAAVGIVHKGSVYEGVAKPTVKQTTMCEMPLGNATLDGVGAYTEQVYDLKVTQKQTFVDEDYYGGASMGKGGGEAYKLAEFDAKATMKQEQKEYFGNEGSAATGEAPTSYADIYNATTNGLREAALVIEHEPTMTGLKVNPGPEAVSNFVVNKMSLDTTSDITQMQMQRPAQMPIGIGMSVSMGNFTKTKQNLRNDDRLDLEILEPFKKNPYTQSLHSY